MALRYFDEGKVRRLREETAALIRAAEDVLLRLDKPPGYVSPLAQQELTNACNAAQTALEEVTA